MRPCAFFILSIIIGIVSLPAKTVELPDDNISIDVPDAWQQSDRPGMLLFAESGPYMMQLIKSANPRNVDLNADVIQDIKNNMEALAERHGGTVNFGDEGPLTMGGAPAYVIHVAQAVGSTTTQISLYVVDANRSLYVLYLVTTGTMPDATLQGIADSFRFTSPPALPESTFARRAFKIGVALGGLLVLAIIGGAIWFFVRRSRSE
jgi:hypothetical protein